MPNTPSWVIPAKTQQPQTQTPTFDPSKQGTHQGAFDYLNGNIDSSQIQNQGQWTGGEGGSYQDNFVDTRDHGIFKDAVSITGRDYDGEAATGGGPKYQLDYTKLPNQGMTKFGRIDQVYQVKNINDVLNPQAVVWDDNYGWVTSRQNRKPRLGDQIGPGIASLAMGGLMGAALPAGMLSSGVKTGFGALPQIAKGNYQGAGLSLLGAGLGAFGQGIGMEVPKWVIPAAKTGYQLSQMYTKGRG